MRIRELKLIRYGKFSDRAVSLPLAERDIHLIVGPNEAGKSTVRKAIGDWLFGIPVRTPLAFLHPMPDLRIGGVIERGKAGSESTDQLAFDRTKGNKNTLRSPEDIPLADGILQSWLGSLQLEAFNRMHALDHTTLVEGGDGILSASDDIGRMLFQSASGVEHLGEALKKLQAEAEALWAPRKSGTRAYYQAQEAYDTANAEFKRAMLRTRDWKARHDSLASTETQLAEAKCRDAMLRQQISRLERIRRVRPLLLALDAAHTRKTELLATGEIPLLEEGAAKVFAGAMQEISLAQADISRLQGVVAETRAALQETTVDESILIHREEITELNERRLQFRAHASDMVKREEEVRQHWLKVQELASGLGWSADCEEVVRNRLPGQSQRARLSLLLKGRSALVHGLKTAQTSLSECQLQIQQAEKELLALASGAVDPELALMVEQGMKLSDHEQVMTEWQDEIDGLARRIEESMSALGSWRQPLAALLEMVVPDTAQIQGLLDQHKADAAEEKTAQDALEAKTREVTQRQLELQQFVRKFQPVSREQVMEARRTRDGSWSEIKRSPSSLLEHAASFEDQIVQADTLADDRLERAQYEADRQSKAEALEQAMQERAALQDRVETIQRRVLQRLAQWEALASACGLPALPLNVATGWLESRQRVLDLERERSSVERRRSIQEAAATQLGARLWARLGRPPPMPALSMCLREARLLITQADQAQGQRKALEQQIREGTLSLGKLQLNLQAAQGEWDTWRQSWLVAVQSSGYDDDVPVDLVEAELGVMQEIERLLERIRSVRSERIETMQADLDGLAASAASLSARLASDLCDLPAEDIAMELARRLDAAQRAEAATSDWLARLERSQAELADARKRLESVHARLAHLMAAAGAEDVTTLGQAIERSDARRALEDKIQSAEQALGEAAEGLPVEVLRQENESMGADALKAELERLTNEAGPVVDQIASLSNEYGALKSAFDALDGTDLAARAESQRQEAIAAMADVAERYLRLQTAVRLLKWSIEKFRETRQGPMLAKASEIFKVLTLDSFSRLLVDAEADTPRLIGIRPTGEQVDVSGMSEGSRDQLYLALRLAALELQVEQGFAMPLIADDLFINFDDQRTAAGLSVLGALSRHMQVIFLTHHEHLVPLAREVLGPDLNVVWL